MTSDPGAECCARNKHALLFLIAASTVLLRRVVGVKACTPAGAAPPVGKDASEFFRLVRKDLELDVAALYLHVGAHSLEERFCCRSGLVVTIWEVLGSGEDDLRLEHAPASQHFLQTSKALSIHSRSSAVIGNLGVKNMRLLGV